jgi:hypothetical protein
MEQRRKFAIIALGGVVLFFVVITLLKWLSFGPPSRSEQWGLLVGAIVGGLVCRYMAIAWDPAELRPMNPQARSGRDLNAGCVLPLITGSAALTSTLIVQFVGADVQAFLGGAINLSLVILLSYMIIQVWRYRPRE